MSSAIVKKVKTTPPLFYGYIAVFLLVFLFSTAGIARPLSTPVWYDYDIIAVYPHDRQAFTQGLLYRDGFLYESTGRYGRSTLRKVRLETGEILQQRKLDHRYFGEGLADWNESLIQLTWKAQVGFVYDLETFAPLKKFSYSGEGWGLTRLDDSLVMSNGSAELLFLDPETLTEQRRVTVTVAGEPVMRLNELEAVDGEIYANIWQTDIIVIINPQDGNIVGLIDLTGLLSATDRLHPVDVLNGIAYDNHNERLFVTGKLWPKLFEIKLRPRSPSSAPLR